MVPTSEGLGRQETGRGKDREKEEEACLPGNSVFMKNSFLMRSASSELCLLP